MDSKQGNTALTKIPGLFLTMEEKQVTIIYTVQVGHFNLVTDIIILTGFILVDKTEVCLVSKSCQPNPGQHFHPA